MVSTAEGGLTHANLDRGQKAAKDCCSNLSMGCVLLSALKPGCEHAVVAPVSADLEYWALGIELGANGSRGYCCIRNLESRTTMMPGLGQLGSRRVNKAAARRL
jgi:hypothetical protein